MRRRPIEFWWITAFGVFTALAAHNLAEGHAGYDRNIIQGYAIAFLAAPACLLCFLSAGRWACLTLLGLEALLQSVLLFHESGRSIESRLPGIVCVGFCVWMICYLQSASTRRLCQRQSSPSPLPRAPAFGFRVLSVLEVGICAALARLTLAAGVPPWIAGAVGIALYVLYGLLAEEWVRRRWMAYFAHCEPDFPLSDAGTWRAACGAYARRDFSSARWYLESASSEARSHPSLKFFSRMLEWHELLQKTPRDGKAALARAVFDHDWRTNDADRARVADYVSHAETDEIRALIENRAALLEGLVAAVQHPRNFFFNQADRTLSAVTGEAFAFNMQESWADWWRENREHWSGDAGSVSIVARLMRLDADVAANNLAGKMAGRAEEPLLKELTAQVLFLNKMQKAIRDHDGVEPFVRQPQRMLLVPELTDAVGMLHADSKLLDSLGMGLPQVARRLALRVPLVDYVAGLWQRYPNELNSDMPWLVRTLINKPLGVFRARYKFQTMWPAVRDSYIRHDRAVVEGLREFAAGDIGEAERWFRLALAEQPRELSSRYNLFLCVMRRDAHGEAARLLQELTQLEPKEQFWWMVLGEMYRSANKASDARAAFRKAQELGAAAPNVALHIGITYAHERREDEAMRQFDRALGTDPTPSRLDLLVSRLENEGLWKLAGHYREEAFRRSLGRPEKEEDGDVPDADEDVAA